MSWGDDTYQVISHINEDVPVYVIENKWDRRQTKLFQTLSTMMFPGTPHQEASTECQPPSELETDVDAQDTSGWRLLESMSNAVNCMSNAVGAVKAAIARRWPYK